MSRDELLALLIELGRITDEGGDCEKPHRDADKAMFKWVRTFDKEIADAYDSIGKWYA